MCLCCLYLDSGMRTSDCMLCVGFSFFLCKQKTAYEMRISDWSSDVCSSDLTGTPRLSCGVRRKIGAVCRYGCCALCQLFRRDGGYDGEQHGTIGSASGRDRVCQYV